MIALPVASFSLICPVFSGSLHQIHDADTVEEEESENELSTNQTPNMAATTDQPSTDAKVIQPTQDTIGQNTGHVTTGAVRFKDSDQADAGKSDHTVNGQGVRPKAKQLHRKNTPATLPTVQKLCKFMETVYRFHHYNLRNFAIRDWAILFHAILWF